MKKLIGIALVAGILNKTKKINTVKTGVNAAIYSIMFNLITYLYLNCLKTLVLYIFIYLFTKKGQLKLA
ncbi:hypothetical protein GCM10011351_05070 [Paraliobacillus quinghaiensis]|uniref:Uncharacterized protein n=1 Tax=Paraliobacillus quinghaiensis TaxID=470815 RepID=A0A917WR82_9BACI|nr:hypothetical protein GCM10011351_05070 [Paraliobacillus quinghaiensis]